MLHDKTGLVGPRGPLQVNFEFVTVHGAPERRMGLVPANQQALSYKINKQISFCSLRVPSTCSSYQSKQKERQCAKLCQI